MTAPATHVVMGRIGAPWGIKGWVKLFSFADPLDNLLEYHTYYIQGSSGLEALEFAEMKAHGKSFVGRVKGCEVREAAVLYVGLELMLDKAELPSLDEGYYWYQLEGLRVKTLSGQDLGTVHHLLETGANDVLVVRGDEQSEDREERLLPYVKEAVVKTVDLATAVILVDWDKEY
jgi:16S rRNA processing protein RimM